MTIHASSMADDLARRIRVQLGEFNDDDLGVTELVRNLAEFKRAHLAQPARLRKIEEERWSVVAMRNSAIERAEKAEALLRGEAALLRAWAKESREGGWSTHQVGPMSRRADEITAHLGSTHE